MRMAGSGSSRQSRGPDDGAANPVIVATIAAGGKRADAAAAAGVSQRTVYRRLSDPDVARAIADARARLAAVVLTRAADLADAAMQTLADVMADKDEPAAGRIAAARTVLVVAGSYGERIETAQRLEALESALRLRKV